MDLRIQKTKNSIFQAFVELRENLPLEKITVKELTTKAQISKQTFYLHYRDIYDLSEQLEAELIQKIMDDLPYPENILTHSGAIVEHLFSKAIEQGALFRIVFSGSRVNALIDGLEQALKEAIYIKSPELRSNLHANILITILVQGCYHAYEQYSTIDQDRVVNIISKIANTISGTDQTR